MEIDLRYELPLADCSQTALRQIRRVLEDNRLKLAAVTYPTRRGLGDEAELDRRLAAISQAMTIGGGLGARVLVNPIGELLDDEASPQFARLVESLTLLGSHGDRVGTRLATLTDLGSGDEGPQQLATLLGHLPSGVIGAALDPAALIASGQSPQETIQTLGPHLIYVYANDAVRDLAERRVIEVPLGRGSADFPELLGALEEYEYQGWVTIRRNDSDDPVTDIDNAISFLRTM